MEHNLREVYSSYPTQHRKKLLLLRELIFNTAIENPEIGTIEETLKWGDPSYVTSNKNGSTIRFAWHKKTPNKYGMYFNCKTNLIASFQKTYGELFQFESNRAIIFHENEILKEKELKKCIKKALTYHLNKTRKTA